MAIQNVTVQEAEKTKQQIDFALKSLIESVEGAKKQKEKIMDESSNDRQALTERQEKGQKRKIKERIEEREQKREREREWKERETIINETEYKKIQREEQQPKKRRGNEIK